LFGRWRRDDSAVPTTPSVARAINWVRPPGAIDPSLFVQACDGCAECATACPAQAINMSGPAVAGRKPGPRIDATQNPCVMCDEIACIASCPTGALAPTARAAIRIAEIRFDESRCWSADGTEPTCQVCADRCPVGSAAITVSPGNGPTIDIGCTGCGVCVHYCPASPPPLIQLPPRL
jgi:ferredoxin-type protein NapG